MDEQPQQRWRSLRLIAFLVGMPLVIGLATVLFVRLVPRTSCTNEVVAEQLSEGAAQRAVVFRRDCGPRVPVTTNVSIVAADAPLSDDVGNVAILNDVVEVALRWQDATHLVVGYPRQAGDMLEAGAVRGIEVTLEPR